jgi:hypothetical protein
MGVVVSASRGEQCVSLVDWERMVCHVENECERILQGELCTKRNKAAIH